MLPFERERTLANAYSLMHKHLEDRSWLTEFETFGTGIVTTRCAIRRADGEFVAGGYGKGHPETSKVGALYEAVEHHHGAMENAKVEVVCVPAREIHGSPRFASLPCLSEFSDQKGRKVACALYRDFRDGAAVAIPLFLVFPQYVATVRIAGDDFDYSTVERFGSNSGTAIGATFAEAAIHALNEIVERDAWSLFLLSHFFDARADAHETNGRVVDVGTLPEDLRALVGLASWRAKREVLLVDVTSDLGIPTFAATVDRVFPEEHVYPYGFGTSAYPRYAAYRAITELVQTIDLKEQSEAMRRADEISLGVLSEYGKLRECVFFEIDPNRLKGCTWDFEETEPRDLATLVSETVAQLDSRGIDLCFNVHHEVPGVFCVVSCTSVALERFFLVTSGHAMAPGARGMRLLGR